MKSIARRTVTTALLASVILALGLLADVAHAEKKKVRSERDHDEALSAREGGAVLPLARVLAIVGPQIDGEIIETELKFERGRPVYEFKYVNRNGRVRELYVDARSGTVIKDKPD